MITIQTEDQAADVIADIIISETVKSLTNRCGFDYTEADKLLSRYNFYKGYELPIYIQDLRRCLTELILTFDGVDECQKSLMIKSLHLTPSSSVTERRAIRNIQDDTGFMIQYAGRHCGQKIIYGYTDTGKWYVFFLDGFMELENDVVIIEYDGANWHTDDKKEYDKYRTNTIINHFKKLNKNVIFYRYDEFLQVWCRDIVTT